MKLHKSRHLALLIFTSVALYSCAQEWKMEEITTFDEELVTANVTGEYSNASEGILKSPTKPPILSIQADKITKRLQVLITLGSLEFDDIHHQASWRCLIRFQGDEQEYKINLKMVSRKQNKLCFVDPRQETKAQFIDPLSDTPPVLKMSTEKFIEEIKKKENVLVRLESGGPFHNYYIWIDCKFPLIGSEKVVNRVLKQAK